MDDSKERGSYGRDQGTRGQVYCSQRWDIEIIKRERLTDISKEKRRKNRESICLLNGPVAQIFPQATRIDPPSQRTIGRIPGNGDLSDGLEPMDANP